MATHRATHQAPNVVPLKPGAHAYAPYPSPADYGHPIPSTIAPADLYKHLDIAPFVRLTFPSEKRLMAYRANLYKVNVEGKFRYSTRREGWTSLIITRLR